MTLKLDINRKNFFLLTLTPTPHGTFNSSRLVWWTNIFHSQLY